MLAKYTQCSKICTSVHVNLFSTPNSAVANTKTESNSLAGSTKRITKKLFITCLI